MSMMPATVAQLKADVARAKPERRSARHDNPPERKTRRPQAISVPDDNGDVSLLDLTEDNLAIAFAAAKAGHLLYDHSRGKWLTWDGSRWKIEETRLAFDWVRKFCRHMNVDGSQKWAKASTFTAVEMIARADRRFARTIDQFDVDHWLLATPGGVVNLRTGALEAASPDLMITKSTAVTPAASGMIPRQWLAFLDQATRGDRELIRFLQQVLGYALTGVTIEHMLIFIFGPGGNGKGVFINTALRILGDYAQAADMQVFTASRNDRHPTELAALRGARLVVASETERDRAWAESRIKQLTGGDRIRARYMRQDEFEFDAQFQLVSGASAGLSPDSRMRGRGTGRTATNRHCWRIPASEAIAAELGKRGMSWAIKAPPAVVPSPTDQAAAGAAKAFRGGIGASEGLERALAPILPAMQGQYGSLENRAVHARRVLALIAADSANVAKPAVPGDTR